MTEKPATRASQAPHGPHTPPGGPGPHPAPADASQGRTALRDRMAERLDTHRWTKTVDIGPHSRHGYHALCRICTGDVTAIADAVLHVILAARPDKPRIVVHESDACQGNITGWTCDDCEDGDCEHECHDTEPTGDLRERLEAALRAGRCCMGHIPRVADAVLPVVEAETAALRERAEQAEAYAAYLDEDVIKPERALHEQTIKRAEQAEAAVQRVRAAAEELTRIGRPLVADMARYFLSLVEPPEETS